VRTCDQCGKIRPDSQGVCDCLGGAAESSRHAGTRNPPSRLRRGCLIATVLVMLTLGGCVAILPCIRDIFPAKDGNYDSLHERDVQYKMRKVVNAESRYYARNRRYGHLGEIGLLPHDLMSRGYSLTLKVEVNHFQLIAAPAVPSSAHCCFIGMPRCRWFYTDETQILRHDVHCRPATQSSSSVAWQLP
jgi:hypothetical protein